MLQKNIFYVICLVLIYIPVSAQRFNVVYPHAVMNQSFSGRVILYLSKENRVPKNSQVDLEDFTCFSVNVSSIQPDSVILFDDKSKSYPVKLSDIERGEYYVQAVWDRNLGGRSIPNCPGNIYSLPLKVCLT